MTSRCSSTVTSSRTALTVTCSRNDPMYRWVVLRTEDPT